MTLFGNSMAISELTEGIRRLIHPKDSLRSQPSGLGRSVLVSEKELPEVQVSGLN